MSVPDAITIEYDAYQRLAGARDAIEAILEGRWAPDPAVVDTIADLVEGAGWRFGAVS